LWTSTPTGRSIYSSPAVANGILFVASNDGKLYAFAATGCGKSMCAPLWTSPTIKGDDADIGFFSSPAIANGVIYIGASDGRLYAFKAAGCGKATCSALWNTSSMGYAIRSSPAIANGLVFVGSFGTVDTFSGSLYAFAADGCGGSNSCSPLWTSTPTDFSIESSPAVANDVVYITSWDHKLYAFDIAGCGNPSCPPLWTSTRTGSIIESSPTVAGGVVYVGSDDGRMYAFAATGCGNPSCSPLWTSPSTDDAIYSSPDIANGVIYFGSLDHKLYAFHLRGMTP